MPKIRTESNRTKSLNSHITKRSNSRTDETIVDLTPGAASFRGVMGKNEKSKFA